MKTSKRQRGFTLLELLLVVGIAAILIIAGITTYSLVNKSNSVNEATRLVNILLDQTRRMYAGQSTYGASGADLEAALYNSGSVPAKFRSGTAGTITSPFSSAAEAVAVAAAATSGEFTVSLVIPPAYGPEMANNFDPRQSTEITQITVCGTNITDSSAATAGTPAAFSTACGSSTTVPGTANFVVQSR